MSKNDPNPVTRRPKPKTIQNSLSRASSEKTQKRNRSESDPDPNQNCCSLVTNSKPYKITCKTARKGTHKKSDFHNQKWQYQIARYTNNTKVSITATRTRRQA